MRGLNFGLSTNGKPLFQVLQFWLRFKTLCDSTHFIMIQAILESFLEIAVWLWKLQCDCGNCTLIVGLQSDCGNCTLIVRFKSDCGNCSLKQCSGCLPHSGMWTPIGTKWKNLLIDCGYCSLIVEIAVRLLRFQSDCWDCSQIAEIAVWNGVLVACHTLECGHLGVSQGKILSLIVEIAVWLLRLQSDCWDCSQIA